MSIIILFSHRGMPYVPIDKWYLILVVPFVLLSLIAQALVSNRFKRYSQLKASCGLSASEVARRILLSRGLAQVSVGKVKGTLTDHYSPREKTLRLSDSSYASDSVAAIGVAAHEAGHALQDQANYLPNKLRTFLFPGARLGSAAGPYLAILGLALNHSILFYIGIALFTLAVAFYLVTLPVEFNASARALQVLEQDGFLTTTEIKGVKQVLGAAALTYLASALTSLGSLVRLVLLSRERNRRE